MDLNFFKGKRVLITGATGLIGSNLAVALLRTSVSKLFVTGRTISKLTHTFDEYKDERLVLVEHDASEPIPEVINNIDLIFHAAGPMERNIVLNAPINVVLPNIIGTINLMEFLKKQSNTSRNDGRMIVFSSVTVYNNVADKDICVREADTCEANSLDAPTACYAESKRMSEVIAKAYVRQYGIDALVARLSTVYGYTKNIPDTAFFEFIKKTLAGEDIVLNGIGFPRRDNIYVDDAINGLLTIACEGKSGESYNVSSGGDLENFAAVDEIAKAISDVTSEVTGEKGVNVRISGAMLRKAGLSLDNSKLKALGWSIKTSLRDGIKETICKIINR